MIASENYRRKKLESSLTGANSFNTRLPQPSWLTDDYADKLGRGSKAHLYGGMGGRVRGAGGGRGSMEALGDVSGADFAQAWNIAQPGSYEREMMGETLKNTQLRNTAASEALFEASKQNNPYWERLAGDIKRDESIRDAGASGQAAYTKFLAEEPMRNVQEFDRDRMARQRGYFDPAVAEAQVRGRADVAKAEADKQRERSAAFRAFSDLVRKQADLEPEIPDPSGATVPGSGWGPMDWGARRATKPNPQWEAIQEAIDTARGVIGDTGAGGGKTMTVDDLEAFAADSGISIAEAEELARRYGYRVR